MTRFEIGQALQILIEDARERLEKYSQSKTTIGRNKLSNIIEGILIECQPNSTYSATCATILHTSELYKSLKKEMMAKLIWTNEFENLHSNSQDIILEIR